MFQRNTLPRNDLVAGLVICFLPKAVLDKSVRAPLNPLAAEFFDHFLHFS